MKPNNIHTKEDTNEDAFEIDESLTEHISALKSKQLTENDYQQMESQLQKAIIAQGKIEQQEIGSLSEQEVDSRQLQKMSIGKQLTNVISSFFSWQPIRMAGSMGAIMAVVLSIVFIGAPTKTAFAAVLSQMQKVTSMIYSSKIENNGVHLMDVKVFYREPNQLRVETLPKGTAEEGAVINVMDLNKGKGMLFFPGPKIATPFSFDVNAQPPSPKDDPLYWYQQLKGYQGEPSEYLSAEYINGALAEGFVINVSGAKVTVWAGVESNLPVKLVVTLDAVNDEIPFELVANLHYNQNLDDELFSLELGKGYTFAGKDVEPN